MYPPLSLLTTPELYEQKGKSKKHIVDSEMVPSQQIVGLPENPVVAEVMVFLTSDLIHPVTVPVQYKHTDPVLGELYQPLAVVPPVLVNIPAARSVTGTCLGCWSAKT
ncbi:MAG: hypothetical protein EOO38_05565 [Cytophagaceae bacterium]|nr:MAG: hypothetical protein EOO38_05565 [Cytophagaceae bacterium]